MVTKKVLTPIESPQSDQISIDKLKFDPENPRFPTDIASGSTAALIERFVRDERLLELVESIGNQGYFAGEPLLVTKSKSGFIVLEGNRRLAALKLLTGEIDPPEGRISVESAIDKATQRPTDVPCLIFSDRSAILRYLGFRHITGIKAWSALQKARYIKRLRETYYNRLNYEDSLRALARETGSKGSYIGQVLAALALYEKAEAENFFELSMSVDDVDFSILSTALSYTNIVDFLGLEHRLDVRQRGIKKNNLKLLFHWNFVKGESKRSIVKDSRNLKKLAAIVASPVAVKELVKNGQLDQAFSLSKGPAVALSEALSTVNAKLQGVWALIPSVSEITPQHVDLATDISKQARSVRAQILLALEENVDGENDA